MKNRLSYLNALADFLERPGTVFARTILSELLWGAAILLGLASMNYGHSIADLLHTKFLLSSGLMAAVAAHTLKPVKPISRSFEHGRAKPSPDGSKSE